MAKIVDLGTVGRRWVFSFCFVYFHVNVLTVHSAEKNFWAERRESAKRLAGVSPLRGGADPRNSAEGMAETGLSSGRKAPSGLSTEQYQLLAQLTRAGQFDFGVSQSGSVESGVALAPASFQAKEGILSTTNLPASTAQTSKKISSLILPYGSISEIHLSKKSSAPMVIHIQDAHGIEEAQKNMASIIRGLNDRSGVTLVGVEGAHGKFDLDPYRGPDASVAKDIADYFLKEGKIAGPEYVGLTAPKPPVLFGVEDVNLCLGNVKALRDALKEKSAMTKILFDLKSAVVPLKDTLYSKELKEYEQHFHAYHEQKEGLGVYVRYLLGAYGEKKSHFSNLSFLLMALASEDGLDFKHVEKDRQELVERLAEGLSQARINLLVDRSLQYRSGQLGFGDYHRFLLALCRENKIAIEDLRQMRAYIDYVLLAERIDRNKLLDELSQLEQETQNRLAVTPDQKRLVSVNRRLSLLDKLAAQAMTPADWAAYRSQREGVLKVGSELNELGGKIVADISPEFLAPFEDFCRNAIGRNAALVDNLAEQIMKQKATSAILVSGGFHTEGLTRLLRAKDFSYAVVTPKITEMPKNDNYLDVFARDPLPLEKLFSGERLFLKYPSPMGPAQDGFQGAHAQFGKQVLVFQLAVMLQRGTGAIKDLLQRVIVDAQKLKLNFAVHNVERFSGKAHFDVDTDCDKKPDFSVNSERAEPTVHESGESAVRVGNTRISIDAIRPTLAARIARGFKNIRWGKWVTSLLSPLKFLTRRSNAFWVESVLIGTVFVVTQVGAFTLTSVILGSLFFFFIHSDTWRQIRVLGRKTSTQLEKQKARKRLSSRFLGSFLVVGIVFIFLDPSLIPALSEIFKTESVRPLLTALGFSPALAIGLLVSAGVHYIWNKVLVPRGAGSLSIFDAEDKNLGGGNPYIYDPIMRKTIIAQMATREAYLDAKEEFGVLYGEIQEVFQNVLKAAHDRLLREGKTVQAKSILHADLFLADKLEANAYAMIYFNFVGINTGLLKLFHENKVLTKDLIAFILAHEVTHLLQHQEAVDAGKVEPGLSFSNLDDLIKKKFHDKVNLYSKEQDADVRAVDLVNAAGYNVSEITTFFDVVSQPEMKFRVLDLFSNHPPSSERSAYLRRTRLKGNWSSVAVPQPFSEGAIGELNGPRGNLRTFQEAVWEISTFKEAMALAQKAGSLDALAPIATWAFQRVLKLRAKELIANSLNDTVPSELQEQLNTLLKEINASDSYPFGFVVRDLSLWDQESIDLKIERDPKQFTEFCLTVYLATGRMPELISPSSNENKLNSLVMKMKDAFDENQSIQSVILEKDQLKNKILEQAAALALKGDWTAILQIELLFEKKDESSVDLNKWLAGLSSLPEEKLLDYLRKIKPVQSWSTEKFIGEESLFLVRLKSFRELQMNNLVKEVLQLLVKNKAGQSVSKQLELLMFIKEKESELPGVTFDVGGFLMRLVNSAKFLKPREKSEVVDFIIRHPEFHSNRYVCDFLYSWWVKNKHSKKITKAMESSPVLRKYMFESYLRAFDSDLNIKPLLFKEELFRGEVEEIIKLFRPSELALKLFVESVQKLKPNAEFVEGLTHWRRVAESSYRYGSNWVSSQGSYLNRLHLWALLDGHQNQTINEAQSLLTKAGFNMEGRSVCHEIARLIVFFEAGGLEDPFSFRNMIEQLLEDDNINNDDLALLAKFLNSDYMYELQEKRKMPSLFSLNNVSANAMRKEVIISFGRPSPEQGIVDREFYRTQSWGEYIARFNVLVHMRVTGQAKEYQQLMDIDNFPDLFRGFAGELNERDVDASDYEFDNWKENIFEIQNRVSFSTKVKNRFTELFEKVFQRLIWSSPKYVDRRDMSFSLEKGGLFVYIYDSPKTVQELVLEGKAFLPKSVYRNYWFLHLLARQLHEIDATFDISRPLDLVQIRKHLIKGHRKGLILAQFYETLDEVIPLLVRDARMESINEGLLAFWALKRSGNKSGGIGDPIGDKSHYGNMFRLIDFAYPKNFSDWMSWWEKVLYKARLAYSHIRRVFSVFFQFVYDFYQVIAPLVMLYFFRYWFSLGIAPKSLVAVSTSLIKSRSSHTILHEGDHRLPVLIENHLMESLLKALHKESAPMKFLRAVVLAFNRIFHPTGHVDFFHFDYQGKQTQLDTGLAGLAESRTEADLVSSRDFQEKIDSLLKRYPRPSPARDRILEILAGHETSRLSDKEPQELLLNLTVLRGLFANGYFVEKLGFQAFELERGLRPDLYQWDPSRESLSNVGQLHFDFVEKNVALAKKYFQPGYFRDDILLAILEESWTDSEYGLIEPLLYQYKLGLLKDEEAAKTSYIEDKLKLFLEDATAVDKKDFLLWVLGAKGKPLFLQEWEYYFGINLDRVRGVFLERGATSEGGLNFERVGESAKKELIRQMFAGEGGLLESPAVFEAFMNDMFNHVVPRRGKVSREKLRTILRVILKNSDDNRRVQIVQSLAVNMADALAGESLDQNQVIAKFFESLGLVGVKMAQTLAHSYDVELDKVLRESLATLSSRADPLSKMVVFETINNMYAGGFEENFEYVKNSLGSASVKIVFRARKKGANEDVAFKVKRPEVDQSLAADLTFLTGVLGDLREEGFNIPVGLEKRISGAISEDADFEREAQIAGRFEEQMARMGTYTLKNGTPVDFEIAPIHEVKRNVMETGLAAGISLDREGQIVSRGIATLDEMSEVKKTVFDMLMGQVFRDGFYLADPHGGNFHLARVGGRLKVIFIDSGSAEEVALEKRQDLLEAMLWLAVNPGRTIPQEYLYTSVFFAKLGYLREGISQEEMLEIIFKYMQVKEGDHVLTPKEYLAKIRARFAAKMSFGEKLDYLWRKLNTRSFAPLSGRPTGGNTDPLSDPQGVSGTPSQAGGIERREVPIPSGLPQKVNLAGLDVFVGDSRPIDFEARFRGSVGAPNSEPHGGNMDSYFRDLEIVGVAADGVEAISAAKEEDLSEKFVQAVQSENVHAIGSKLLSMVHGMVSSDPLNNQEQVESLIAGVALIHAKNSAFLAQANGRGPRGLAELRIAQAEDIHLLVQLAASVGVTDAEALQALFKRYYDGTMKKMESLARYEAKGAEEAHLKSNEILAVNLEGLSEKERVGAMSYVVGAARARQNSEGGANVVVVGKNLDIGALSGTYPRLGVVAGKVTIVTETGQHGLYSQDGKLSAKNLVRRLDLQTGATLDVMSAGKDSVLQDQENESGIIVHVRDFADISKTISDELNKLIYVLLQA